MLKVDIKSFLAAKYPLPRIDPKAWLDGLACSQTLYFLFRNGRVSARKQQLRGIYSPQAQGGVGGKKGKIGGPRRSFGATETCLSQKKQITLAKRR